MVVRLALVNFVVGILFLRRSEARRFAEETIDAEAISNSFT